MTSENNWDNWISNEERERKGNEKKIIPTYNTYTHTLNVVDLWPWINIIVWIGVLNEWMAIFNDDDDDDDDDNEYEWS